MSTLNPLLMSYKSLVERELQRALPKATQRPNALHRAMRYSVFAGGKRVRPLLCLATAVAEGGTIKQALPVAAALECLHTYTLIHDDLPAMDDDDLRRGKPTSHKVFGEAMAILAGDALLTVAFELLADAQPRTKYRASDLVRVLAKLAGSRGVVGGQVEDMASEGKKASAKQVAFIHQHKTADLITASLVLGAMIAGSSERRIKLFTKLGSNLGAAFQITDDILNETSDSKTLGKAVKTDRAKAKATAVALWGIDGSRERVVKLYDKINDLLQQLDTSQSELATLIGYIMERKA